MPKILEHFSWTFDHFRLFFKVLDERTVFKSLIHFQRPTKLSLTLFCFILQNVMIYAKKCSVTAQNRGGIKKRLPLLEVLDIGRGTALLARRKGKVYTIQEVWTLYLSSWQARDRLISLPRLSCFIRLQSGVLYILQSSVF